MNIETINNYLKEGKNVKEVRDILNIGEKKFQQQIKDLGYKFDQKTKQYIPKKTPNVLSGEVLEASNFNSNTNSNTLSNTARNTDIIDNTDKENLNFIGENIELLKEMLMYYKRNKESNTINNGIVIDLIDDKNIDNGKPKSVRINCHVWEDWKEFTKDKTHSSKDLISMALKEYMDKYNKSID